MSRPLPFASASSEELDEVEVDAVDGRRESPGTRVSVVEKSEPRLLALTLREGSGIAIKTATRTAGGASGVLVAPQPFRYHPRRAARHEQHVLPSRAGGWAVLPRASRARRRTRSASSDGGFA